MPLRDYMHLISVDDHLVESAHVWEDRLPKRYVDAGPRIVESREGMRNYLGNWVKPGCQVWQYEGRIYPHLGLNAVAGKAREDFGTDPVRFEEMIPGCYDPVERVKDMDLDGVQASVCFPSFPRFAGTVFREGEDEDLALLCVQAWNDYVLDVWCPTGPDRFIPMAILPFWDVPATVAEIDRVLGKGVKALSFPENPVPLGLPSFHTDHWDPVLSAAAENNLPLCIHFGTSGKVPSTAPDAPIAVMIALMSCNSMYAAVDLLFSPVFHRHPNLKVAFSEGGVGWIPHILERADYTWERHRYYQSIDQESRPSELFRRHIWGCFISDEFGVANRDAIGIDRMLWECDYPHSDSNWPSSRKVVAGMFHDVADDLVHRVVELNARELFNFPRVD